RQTAAYPGSERFAGLAGGVDDLAGEHRRVAAGARVLGSLGRLLLVVLGLDVHRPDVVIGAHDVLDGEHGGVHRVVLVVVLVHPVATEGPDVGGVVGQPRAQHLDVGGIGVVVHRIGLGHAHDVAGLDLSGPDQTDRLQLPRAQRDQLVVGHDPQVVALED